MAGETHDSICVIVVDIFREQLRQSLDAVGMEVRNAINTCVRQAAKEPTEERRTTEFTRCLALRARRGR